MCGIVGILNFDRENRCDRNLLEQMVRSLAHRGPDDRGILVANEVGLGMTRLSIIDVAGGHQPVFNEDGSRAIVFNGEIYNFKELRGNLEKCGHVFKTQTDTEVILHGYEEWGVDCVLKLIGIFAFAIWDSPSRRLFMARDHLGVKPLYYRVDHKSLTFASEIKAILQDVEVERSINPQGFRNYLAFGHSIGPETLYAGIKKLLPGHRLICGPDQEITLEKYWDVTWGEATNKSDGHLAEKLRGLLDEIIGMQLVSDVPLGAFLSGGIDSSAIVALMGRKMSEPVKTFSVGFQQGPDFYDELDDGIRAAKFLNTQHHILKAQPSDLIKVLPTLVYHYDEPFADAAAFPTYLVARLAREQVKVVLTGDGADEIFGGYQRYGMDARLAWTQFLPAGFLAFMGKLAQPLVRHNLRWQRGFIALREKEAAARAASWYLCFSNDVCREILAPHHWEEVKGLDYLNNYRNYYNSCAPTTDRLTRMMYADLKTQLVDSYLEKVDKATMAVGLEARVPYLDYRLVEFAFHIPSFRKINHKQSKIILRETLRGLLPRETLDKPKHGFAVPLDTWMRGELKDFIREILFDRRTRERGIFNPEHIEKFYADHMANRASHSNQLWLLVVFELWCRTFLDGSGKP